MNAHRLFATATVMIAASSALAAQPRWKLTETLRIGGAESGPTSFNQINSIEADAKGRILVFDVKTQDLRMFGADGKLIRVIGGAGSGPGEFARAQGVKIARDGRLWVRDFGNQRFSVFTPDGDLERTVLARFSSYGFFWAGIVDRAGLIVDRTYVAVGSPGRGQYAALKYATNSARIDTVPIPVCGDTAESAAGTYVLARGNARMVLGIPFASPSTSTLGLDDDLWCAPSAAKLELLRLRLGTGETLARASREVALRAVSGAERDSAIRDLEKRFGQAGPLGLDYDRIPKTKPIIDGLTVDDQGRLWVRRTTANGGTEFDVFSTNGRLIAVAELTTRMQPSWRIVVRGQNAYAVVLDDDDVPYVARFRITR